MRNTYAQQHNRKRGNKPNESDEGLEQTGTIARKLSKRTTMRFVKTRQEFCTRRHSLDSTVKNVCS